MPHRYRDAFHTEANPTETFVSYDRYDLLVQEARDSLGNRMTVGERDAEPTAPLVRSGHDYRVLKPALVMDPNRNRTTVAFDALGWVVGTARMGKPGPAPAEGDSLEGFVADLTEAEIREHCANPFVDAHGVLGRASARMVYDLFAYWRTRNDANPQAPTVYTLARETHDSDARPADGVQDPAIPSRTRMASAGKFRRRCKPNRDRSPDAMPLATSPCVRTRRPRMSANATSPRWVGSGWTVFNNKGKPVRQYEPFFTDTHRFEFDVRIGVSPVLFYDPVERVVATLQPDHTWEKAVFDPWRQETWDVNDTVLVNDPASDPDVGDFFRRLPQRDYLPTWYSQREGGALGAHERASATKTALHARTPTVIHADTLGRAFLTVVHNAFKPPGGEPAAALVQQFQATRIGIDIEGNAREVRDALGRAAMRYDYDMLGHRSHQSSMDAGERWMLNDVIDKPLYAWNGRDQRVHSTYDALRRPMEIRLCEGTSSELLVGRVLYGEIATRWRSAQFAR